MTWSPPPDLHQPSRSRGPNRGRGRASEDDQVEALLHSYGLRLNSDVRLCRLDAGDDTWNGAEGVLENFSYATMKCQIRFPDGRVKEVYPKQVENRRLTLQPSTPCTPARAPGRGR